MLIETNLSENPLLRQEELFTQLTDPRVRIIDPISPRLSPSIWLRSDLMDSEEISAYITQMRQGKYSHISVIFEDFEVYEKNNRGFLFSPSNLITLWHHPQNNEIKIDFHYLHYLDNEIEKIVKAITQTEIEQLSICAGYDGLVDNPTLSWGDVICVTNALKDCTIHKLNILTEISMYTPDWDGLIEFAASLSRSSITEFRWNKMSGHCFDRQTATELFKEHLSDEQWQAFGSQFQF